MKLKILLLGTSCILLQNCSHRQSSVANATDVKAADTAYYTADDYKKVEKYDTHVHLNVYDTAFIEKSQEDNFRLLTINVNTSYYPPVQEQRKVALALVKAYPDRLAFTTAFTLDDWGTSKWEPQTIAYLKESFEKGAIGVKIWKNIGMGLKDKNGKYVMIDDPRFDPILDYIEKQGKTVLGHLAEPRNAWLPVDSMTVSNDKGYFTNHPEYHMYLHHEAPSYEAEIAARDNMLKKHPKLRFVGAHLGSLEWSVDELAKRLDEFPNMAVDMAARIVHLQVQSQKNWQRVHDFMIKYQDRLIYATDQSVLNEGLEPKLSENIHITRERDWKFFTSKDEMSVSSFPGTFKGLKLPKQVIDKIYHINAEKWFPGIHKG
jgi:predicted TIM-barrel fold metal-dependent hydrolase